MLGSGSANQESGMVNKDLLQVMLSKGKKNQIQKAVVNCTE